MTSLVLKSISCKFRLYVFFSLAMYKPSIEISLKTFLKVFWNLFELTREKYQQSQVDLIFVLGFWFGKAARKTFAVTIFNSF